MLTCRYLLELSEEETATVLDVRRGTVKSRTARALGRLRRGAGRVSELERALVALGRELDVPAAPDLATAVLARIEPRTRRPPRGVRDGGCSCVAACVLAALLATLAIPDARSALLRILHIGGEQIELVDELPPRSRPSPIELELDCSASASTLAQARRDAGFDLRELEEAPDRVYLGDRGTVWFLYGSPEQRAPARGPDAARSASTRPFILKKLAGAGTSVEEVDVDGAPAFFLSGEPHVVMLVDETGEVVEETARLARNVLLWEERRVAYRLEGEFDRARRSAIAKSLR